MQITDKDELLLQVVDAIEPNGNADDELLALLAREGDALSAMHDAKCMSQAVLRDNMEQTMSEADMDAAFSDVMRRVETKKSHKANIVTMTKWWMAIAATVCLAFIVSAALWRSSANEQKFMASNAPQAITRLKSAPVHRKASNAAQTATVGNTKAAVIPQRLLNALGLTTADVATESNTITTKSGKSADMVLPDGTKVWLYADSKITYPKAFCGKERTVYLQGQAEFDVTHDPNHPFVVMTNKLDARVLGTEINVSAYPDEAGHVALIRGIVVVSTHADGSSVRLVPGQGVTVEDNGKLTVKEENMERYLKWKEGYLYFDDANLADVARFLGKWYNIPISFDNPKLRQTRLHFSCDHNESLQRVIELINHFGYFNAAIKGDELCFSEKK